MVTAAIVAAIFIAVFIVKIFPTSQTAFIVIGVVFNDSRYYRAVVVTAASAIAIGIPVRHRDKSPRGRSHVTSTVGISSYGRWHVIAFAACRYIRCGDGLPPLSKPSFYARYSVSLFEVQSSPAPSAKPFLRERFDQLLSDIVVSIVVGRPFHDRFPVSKSLLPFYPCF